MLNFNEIEEFYELPTGINWESVGQGHMNESWYGTYEGEKRYVLRKYCRTNDSEEILLEHKFLNLMKEELGDKIIPPIEMNEKTICRIGHKKFALFPFRKGQIMSRGIKDQIIPAAKALAQVHMAASKIKSRVKKFREPLSLATMIKRREQIESLHTRENYADFEAAGLSQDFLLWVYHEVIKTLGMLEQARRFPIHSDFNQTNLICEGEGVSVSCVLDWDECRIDSPLYDLAGASQMFCQNENSSDLSGDFIPTYLNEIKGDLKEEIEKYIDILPRIRQIVWFEELFVVSDSMKTPVSFLKHLKEWMIVK